MNCAAFTKSFSFNEYRLKKFHHTDASRGVEWNYIARMKSGSARFITETQELCLEPGDVFYIPYGCRYHSWWNGNDDICWYSYAFLYFPNPENRAYPLQKIEADETALELIERLSLTAHTDCSSVGMLYQILGLLLPQMTPAENTPENMIVERATEFMEQVLNFSISDVARYCSVSESGLYAAFRSLGTTPVTVKQRLQIDRAAQLLSTTDLTVEDICERTGFNSVSYFLRVLKKLTGKSSRELRRSAVI